MTGCHPFSVQAGRGQAHLRLMELTDIHMHLLPYDYYADRPLDTVGLARTASLVEAARAEAGNSLLFDNGDFLQGNPMGDYLAYASGFSEGDTHPLIAAMNRLEIDAATLGNHEFNYGLDFLGRTIAGARYPLVSANVVRRRAAEVRADRAFLPPYTLLDRTLVGGDGRGLTIRIGVIGLLPPQIMTWDSRHLDGSLEVRGIVEAAQAWVPEMLEAGADIIVALAHTGIGAAKADEGQENAAIPLAALPGIDALFLGHKHLVFPARDAAPSGAVDPVRGTLHGKPAVMAGCWGSHLGLIDLLLERGPEGWQIASFDVSTRPIAARTSTEGARPLVRTLAAVSDAVRTDHEATLAFVRRPVGTSSTPIQSYFAQIGCAPSVELVNRAMAWHARPLLARSPHADLPLVCAAAPFKTGGRSGPGHYTDVPAGDLTIRSIADIYIYPNTLSILRVTGADLRLWLERAAAMFLPIEPGGRDQPLIDPEFSGYNFDILSGLDYRIDLASPPMFAANGALIRPETRRIADLTHRGAAIADDMVFAVATNNYRAAGGGSFPGADGRSIILDTHELSGEVVYNYVRETGTIRDLRNCNWSFCPMPATTAVFDTGPGAAKYEDEVDHLRIERLGPSGGGFLRYRLDL